MEPLEKSSIMRIQIDASCFAPRGTARIALPSQILPILNKNLAPPQHTLNNDLQRGMGPGSQISTQPKTQAETKNSQEEITLGFLLSRL